MNHETFVLPISPCPWCKKMPMLRLWHDDKLHTGGTWLWKIECDNYDCKVRPISNYVAIRNTTKKSYERMKDKLLELANYWNVENPLRASEGKLIDLNKILNEKPS
jgi:hypothetical protein